MNKRTPPRRGAVPRPPRDAFDCVRCGHRVSTSAPGTRHRNHCPRCLWSRHLDVSPGDRRSRCRAAMSPVAIEARPDGEWAVLHRCTGCGVMRANRVAGDDAELALLALALRPLSRPPFPLDDFLANNPLCRDRPPDKIRSKT